MVSDTAVMKKMSTKKHSIFFSLFRNRERSYLRKKNRILVKCRLIVLTPEYQHFG